VTLADLKEFQFPSRVTKLKLAELLKQKYPDHNWDPIYLLKGKFGQQKRLERAVSSLFKVCRNLNLPRLDLICVGRTTRLSLTPERKPI